MLGFVPQPNLRINTIRHSRGSCNPEIVDCNKGMPNPVLNEIFCEKPGFFGKEVTVETRFLEKMGFNRILRRFLLFSC
jgi:hypothetical protein